MLLILKYGGVIYSKWFSGEQGHRQGSSNLSYVYDTIWGLLFWGVLASSSLHQEWSPVLNQRPGNLSLENDKVPRFTRYVCW